MRAQFIWRDAFFGLIVLASASVVPADEKPWACSNAENICAEAGESSNRCRAQKQLFAAQCAEYWSASESWDSSSPASAPSDASSRILEKQQRLAEERERQLRELQRNSESVRNDSSPADVPVEPSHTEVHGDDRATYSGTKFHECVDFASEAAYVHNRCTFDVDIHYCDKRPGTVYSCLHGLGVMSVKGGSGGMAQPRAGKSVGLGANVAEPRAWVCLRGDELTEQGVCRSTR